MINVEIKSFIENFKEQYKNALLKHEMYGIEEFDVLLNSLNTLCIAMNESEDFYIPLAEHKVDKFGLGEMAVRFANSGQSCREVAETISVASGVAITEAEMKEWFENYSNLRTAKTKKSHGNIFDIQERMQEVYGRLMDHIEEVEKANKQDFANAKTTKQQVILDIYKEIRHLSKDATDVIKSINHHQKLEQFKMLVIETIRKIDPATATIILQQLEKEKALFDAILPPGS